MVAEVASAMVALYGARDAGQLILGEGRPPMRLCRASFACPGVRVAVVPKLPHFIGCRRAPAPCWAVARMTVQRQAAHRIERLPASLWLRALRVAAPGALFAVAAFAAFRAPAGCQVGHVVTLTAAVAVQGLSVATAVEAGTQGVNFRRRGQLLWSHAALSVASFVLLGAAMLGVPAVIRPALRFTVAVATLLSSWALANGAVAFMDPRSLPAPMRAYLAHFGSVARGKAIFIKYHRTVGAMAYCASTAALCFALRRSHFPVQFATAVALIVAASALLIPSALRGRFPLPGISVVSESGLRLKL